MSFETDDNTYYRMVKTTLEMLKDRGYRVDEELMNSEFDDFILTYGSPIDLSKLNKDLIYENEANEKIMVFYELKSKITKELILEISRQIQNNSLKRFILVVHKSLHSASSMKRINQFNAKKDSLIEVFTHQQLLFNITRHILVPKHVPLTPEQKAEVLATYKITEDKIPVMFVTDPVAKYFGVKAGTVMEITRNPETSGRYVTYRLVQ